MKHSLNKVHNIIITNDRKESMDSNHFVLLWESIQGSRVKREEKEDEKTKIRHILISRFKKNNYMSL